MASSLTLVSNPGSASRKYGLYNGDTLIAQLHFEWLGNKIICTAKIGNRKLEIPVNISNLSLASGQVTKILQDQAALKAGEHISKIGLRIVAPGTFFAKHHKIDQHFVDSLQAARHHAPLHITATLEELKSLHHQFPKASIIGVSDSAFHSDKPVFAQLYSIPINDAKKLDIKRFGYHGLSAESVVNQLKAINKLTPRLIIAHLGSGASITAVYYGKSLDNTMGYSPLEGITMATRSGSIDFTAVKILKAGLNLSDEGVEKYLNKQSGLMGLGGSSDIRELLERHDNDNRQAEIALQIYFYNIQKAIGQMVGALGGIDQLVFTGTVGERNPLIRKVVTSRLDYLDLKLDSHTNYNLRQPVKATIISSRVESKPILVVPANESKIIAFNANRL